MNFYHGSYPFNAMSMQLINIITSATSIQFGMTSFTPALSGTDKPIAESCKLYNSYSVSALRLMRIRVIAPSNTMKQFYTGTNITCPT